MHEEITLLKDAVHTLTFLSEQDELGPTDTNRLNRAIRKIMRVTARLEYLDRMPSTASSRIPKRNPSLLVYGNPPMKGMLLHHLGNKDIVGRISNSVFQIKYEHVDDGQPYVHDFDEGVVMLAVLNGRNKSIFIQGENGQPLWEDFE